MYTIWLMPDNDAYLKLSNLIEDLSSVHQTPRFEPHVTLLSGITDDLDVAKDKLHLLARQMYPISVSLTHIDFLEYFYRCLFFNTDKSPSLIRAREKAEELFEHLQITPFIPHVSFLYGSIPTFKKEVIIQELGDEFWLDFTMKSLRLVSTQRTPENWSLIEEIEL